MRPDPVLLQATLDSVGDGLVVVDGDGRALFYNRPFARIFDLPADGSATHEDIAAAMARRLEPSAQAIDGPHDGADSEAATTIRLTDGRVLERHASAFQPGTAVDGCVIVYRDVTHRRALEEELRQAQKLEAIGRLAGGVAHDLNNALTAIAGFAELVLGDLPPDHHARSDVTEMRKAAERAGSVTRQLLAFSRREIFEPRLFDLSATATGLWRLLGRLLGDHIHLALDIEPELPPILGDPGQVEQAIVNLALNARDAMPQGGRLTLSALVETVDDAFARAHAPMSAGRYVVLRVADTGHGMSPETRARIFEPFFTTKSTGQGTGLGLSMVYATMKQCKGFIFVESERDRGSTFRLYFPPAEAPPSGLRRDEATGATRAARTPTVLVVDDEPSVRTLVAAALRTEGYRILQAASGDEAIEAARGVEDAVDLLLTDATMPGMSGLELAHDLLARRPGLAVIVMSGYTQDHLSLAGLGGDVSVCQKPFTPRELRARVRQALHR